MKRYLLFVVPIVLLYTIYICHVTGAISPAVYFNIMDTGIVLAVAATVYYFLKFKSVFSMTGYVLLAAGSTFNVMVMVFNNGMPASMPGTHFNGAIASLLITDSTVLPILSDIINIGNCLFSIGDLLMLVGGVIFASSVMLYAYSRYINNDKKMIKTGLEL